MFINHAKSFLISASFLSILAVSFSNVSFASGRGGKIPDDKGKEEATKSNKPKKTQPRKDSRNIDSQNSAASFQFGAQRMQEVVKEDVFACLRSLKAPQIYKPSDEQEGFQFDEFKRNLPKSEQESLRAKRLLHSLTWQCEISRDLCSNLRRQTELSKLESLQADEAFALRLIREQAVDPFKGEGFGFEGFEGFEGFQSTTGFSHSGFEGFEGFQHALEFERDASTVHLHDDDETFKFEGFGSPTGFSHFNFEGFKCFQPAIEFVPLEFDNGTPIAHPQDDDETVEMMDLNEEIASNPFIAQEFRFDGFQPDAGFIPLEFENDTMNFQFPQFEGNNVPIYDDETKLSLDETTLSFLKEAAQIPPVFDPNNFIEMPSAPSYWDLPVDVQLSNPLFIFISELPIAQATDNQSSKGRKIVISSRGAAGRRK